MRVPARGRPPTAVAGDLPRLVEPGSALDLLRNAGLDIDRAEPDSIRLRPGTGALVGYRVHGHGLDGSEVSLPAYVRTFTGPWAEALAREQSRIPSTPTAFGDGIRPLPGGWSVLFLFPNDHALRSLRLVARMKRLKRVLAGLDGVGTAGYRVSGRRSAFSPVRYRPGHRFVARSDAALEHLETGERAGLSLFVRYFADCRGEQITRTARLLHDRGGFPHIPTQFGSLLDGRLSVEESVDGEQIVPALLAGRGDAEGLSVALARLHRSPVDLGHQASAAGCMSRATEMAEALCALRPDLRPRATEVLADLQSSLPAERASVPIHGDLHLGHILLRDGEPVFVDLERAGMGDPGQDLGSLVADMLILAESTPASREPAMRFEEDLVDEYMQKRSGSRRDLGFFTACALLERGLAPFRLAEESWPDRARKVLDLAALRVRGHRRRRAPARPPPARHRGFFAGAGTAGGLRWETFHPRREGAWPGFMEHPDGGRVYGLFDPTTDGFRPVLPREDPVLETLGSWLHHGELIAYRPAHRAVVRVPEEGITVYAKLLPPAKARVLERRVDAAHARAGTGGDPFPELPPLVGRGIDGGVLVFGEVPGTPLGAFLAAQSGRSGKALAAAAEALARLHDVPAASSLPPPGSPLIPVEWISLVADHFPERAGEYGDALLRVSRTPTGPFSAEDRLVHGDLHDGNILVAEGHVGLTDLDSLHSGDPAEDVGNLAAQLVLRALERGGTPEAGRRDVDRFLHAYRESGGRTAPRAVASVGARTLFCLGSLYLFRRSGQRVTGLLLDEAVRWSREATRSISA